MTEPGFRGWKFLPPEGDDGAAGLAIGPRGEIAMVEDEASVRQAILLLLSTSPGERVMRPTYGCELHELVFAGNHQTTAGLAIHYVRRAVEKWEPRVEIERLDAGPWGGDPSDQSATQPGMLQITLEYRVRSTGRSGRIVHGLKLESGA